MTMNSATASSATVLRVGEAHNPRLIIANCANQPRFSNLVFIGWGFVRAAHVTFFPSTERVNK